MKFTALVAAVAFALSGALIAGCERDGGKSASGGATSSPGSSSSGASGSSGSSSTSPSSTPKKSPSGASTLGLERAPGPGVSPASYFFATTSTTGGPTSRFTGGRLLR